MNASNLEEETFSNRESHADMTAGPVIFILSWERPLYLWTCLDSLRRNTRTPCRFVLIDNDSRDPVVNQVISAFEARDMFHAVLRRRENSPMALEQAIATYERELGDYFGYVESDVAVAPSDPDWLTHFQRLTREHPRLGMLGSLVDKSDFVDRDWAARRFKQLSSEQIFALVKPKSPERTLQDHYDEPLIDPFNPPGRFLFLKTELIRQTGVLRDRLLYEAAKRLGYQAAIATAVRHRHLSFQNVFDYPQVDFERRSAYYKELEKGRQ